jgi:hypothetical protein
MMSVLPLLLVASIRPTVTAWPRLPGVHCVDEFPGAEGAAGKR